MAGTAHVPYRERLPVPTNGRQRLPENYNADPYEMPSRSLTVQKLGFTASTTLRIRLVGQWLAAAGFHAGTPVTVKVQYQQLVIVPAPEEGA